MKRAKLALSLLAITMVIPLSVEAESADKIIGRYKKVVGGGAAARVRTTTMTGSVRIGDGTAGRFSSWAASPDRLRTDIDAGSVKFSECYNGKSGWRRDAKVLRTVLGPDLKLMRLTAVLAGSRLRDLRRHRIVSQPARNAQVDGREASVVEFILDDVRVRLFFDRASGLPSKREHQSPGGAHEVFYRDYRKIDGVLEPFSITIKNTAGEMQIAIDQVQHNPPIEDSVFRHPQAEAGEALPDLETLLKAVRDNQEKLEQLREHYTFRSVETEREVDSKGELRVKETRVYDVTPVAGTFVNRLISVNGRELSQGEREKEDRRVLREVEEALKEQEKKKQKQQQARERGEGEKPEKGEVTILTFLKMCEITSVRRELFRGHEVIAFRFEPRKGFKPTSLAESIVSKFAGTIWVDEKAREVARLEARLTDSFKLGGGLVASLSPSSSFVFEQEKVDGEVWLPSYIEAVYSGRIMLLKRIRENRATRFSDYKKYQIGNEYTLTQPKPASKPEM